MAGFEPPPYPYDRLDGLKQVAAEHPGGAVDLSVGTPCDPPAEAVVRALAGSGTERSYPPSVGTPELRRAAAAWIRRRFGVEVPEAQVAATVGSKELVAGLPHWLRLRAPQRDTVLYPAVSYPSYAMGATLAGCRAVAVPVDERWRLRLGDIDEADADRALCLWVNTPGNPAGGLDDLAAAAAWGRSHGVPVLSDECYAEFTWSGRPRTILESGSAGVLAVHSLSKRSNLAGVRVGFYAGDADLVHYLSEVRKHAGLMVPGPGQAAAAVALGDDASVDRQRGRYQNRLKLLASALASAGLTSPPSSPSPSPWPSPLPEGGFYLWVAAPQGDAWALARRLAEQAGVVVSPGEFYGPAGADHVRIAAVQPDDRIQLVADRLAG